jgi:hypothetical protein
MFFLTAILFNSASPCHVSSVEDPISKAGNQFLQGGKPAPLGANRSKKCLALT